MKAPIPNSYWVEPGVLLAGEHPDAGTPARTRKRLGLMAKAGVRHFIDLTEPGELPPYETLLPAGTRYRNFPIVDHSVPEGPQRMREIIAALAEAQAQGGGIYVHCRAGIGRTGITVACYLRSLGAPADRAVDMLNQLWQQNARAARWPLVPETDEQLRYIHTWEPVPADPVAPATAPAQSAPAQPAPHPQGAARHRGCLLGLALGDALAGSPDAEPDAGLAWSDDTGMTLCVLESLLDNDGFDGRDQLDRYLEWHRNPRAAGAHPDAALPASVHATLLRALRSHAPLQGSHDPTVIDPAPLVRSAAAALFAGGDAAYAEELAADAARVTHQAQVAVDSCRVFAVLLAGVLAGEDKASLAGVAARLYGGPLREEVLQVTDGWEGQAGRRPAAPAILGALDRAARAFLRTADFSAGLARLQEAPGPDPGATFAAFGALAGAWHGEAGLPAALLQRLHGRERLEALGEELYQRTRATRAAVP